MLTPEDKRKRLEKARRKYKERTRDARRKKNSYNDQKEQEAHEKVLAAMELIRAGLSYREIVKANIGFSNPGNVKRAVDKFRAKEIRTASRDVVALDLERLDEYQQRATHALRQNGDLSQIDRLLRIMHERYALLQIDGETLKELRTVNGIVTNNVTNNSVMVVQARETTENDFVKQMMGAVGVNPDSPEAQKYLAARTVKQIEGKKKKKVVRRVVKKKTPTPAAPPLAKSYGEIAEDDIVDAEIVGPGEE
jgi:hypothetical protein